MRKRRVGSFARSYADRPRTIVAALEVAFNTFVLSLDGGKI